MRAKVSYLLAIHTYIPYVGSVLTASEATICYPYPPEENIRTVL